MRGSNQDYLLPQANGWRPITTPFVAFGVLVNISTIGYDHPRARSRENGRNSVNKAILPEAPSRVLTSLTTMRPLRYIIATAAPTPNPDDPPPQDPRPGQKGALSFGGFVVRLFAPRGHERGSRSRGTARRPT